MSRRLVLDTVKPLGAPVRIADLVREGALELAAR